MCNKPAGDGVSGISGIYISKIIRMRGIEQGYINKWGVISEIVITPKYTFVNLIRLKIFECFCKEQVFK